MNVLVSTLGGDGGKSGISQYIIQTLKALPTVAPDIQCDVLVFKGEEDLYISDPNAMRAVLLPDNLRSTIRSLAWQQFALPGLCRRGGYDLAFFPAANRRLPFRVPCPSVGTYHDLAIRHVPDKYDRLHSFYSLHVLPVMVRRLSHVITVSKSSERDIREYIRVPADRITVIPEGVDFAHHYPRDKAAATSVLERKYGVRPPFILYISRLEHPGKNHVRLIRAFDRLKTEFGFPHQLVLAGSDWPGAEIVHQAAASCASAKDILFTGFVQGDDVPNLYSAADVFVFPSLFEGFGLPVLEAMACGVPVACSDTSSLPEVAGDAAVLFDGTKEESIADALARLLGSEDKRKRLSEKGLRWSSGFSWEASATATAEVFRGVLKNASPGT